MLPSSSRGRSYESFGPKRVNVELNSSVTINGSCLHDSTSDIFDVKISVPMNQGLPALELDQNQVWNETESFKNFHRGSKNSWSWNKPVLDQTRDRKWHLTAASTTQLPSVHWAHLGRTPQQVAGQKTEKAGVD